MKTNVRRVFKSLFIALHNLIRRDIVFIPPFIKVDATFCGVRSKFLTHSADRVHGGFVRRDNRPDHFSLGEIRFLRRSVRPGGRVLDIGANLGSVAITLAKSEPSCHIYCFEPEPTNYAMLVMNVAMNNIHNITPFNFAVGTSQAYINMYLNEENYGDHRSFPPKGEDVRFMHVRQPTPVLRVDPVATLRDALGTEAPQIIDVIKIDTQGADFDVLRSVLPICGEGTVITIEYSPYHLAEFGETWESIEKVLCNFGVLQKILPSTDDVESIEVSLDQLRDYFEQGKERYAGYIDLALLKYRAVK